MATPNAGVVSVQDTVAQWNNPRGDHISGTDRETRSPRADPTGSPGALLRDPWFSGEVEISNHSGGTLRLISAIHPPVGRKNLDRLGLASKPPPLARPAPAKELLFNFE